jgi:ferredoxin-NADP reductase/Na+-translocating ferredoxin:NAD+ oxidoreductase RnfD subunit
MLTFLDSFLDRITMYRLVLYYLIGVLIVAVFLSIFGWLPYNALAIIETSLTLVGVCLATNYIFATVFQAPVNVESAYITALILACILTPFQSLHTFIFIVWAGALAMASKYILGVHKKHFFNPVAISVVVTAFWLNQAASWWIGTTYMVPVVIVGGLLVTHKIRRFDLVLSFFVTALLTTATFSFVKGSDALLIIKPILHQSAFFFFAFTMLTEPLTTPPTRMLRILYGGLVGVLFAPQLHIGSVYSTPELALIIGNIFSFFVSPKVNQLLTLAEKIPLSSDVTEFVFTLERPLRFTPGQYLEFTLPHTHPDARGNRRYFTIASSPTENVLRLGSKFYDKGSSFKDGLQHLQSGDKLMAGQLAGDFVLPHNLQQKLAFLAGGIGITPFRSMAKFLIDTPQQRDIMLLYMNKTAEEIVYRDIFEAAAPLGLRTVYTLTDSQPKGWTGRSGRIDGSMVRQEIPDYPERIFYLSGPHGMVTAMKKVLVEIGVKPEHIKEDFFPGFV